MKPLRAVLPCLFLTFGLPFAASLSAQNPESQAKTSGISSFKIGPIRQLRKDVDAWPLILNASNPSLQRVNAALTSMNRKMLSTLRECDTNYIAWAKIVNKLTGKASPAHDWVRKVRVTMHGPAYLSLVATNSFFCGGVHPYMFTEVAVFDLKTGEPADPLKWFESSSNASYAADVEQPDPPLEKSISARGLLPKYRELTNHECDNVYTESQPFLIWPDASSGHVILVADVLAGCCRSCDVETGLTLEQARKLGFDESFLKAIQEAH